MEQTVLCCLCSYSHGSGFIQAQHLLCLVLGSSRIDTCGPEQITPERITTEDHLALSHKRTHTGTVKRISLYSLHIPLAEECWEESHLLGTLKISTALSRMKHGNSHSMVLRKQARSEVEINRRGREEHYEQSGINR